MLEPKVIIGPAEEPLTIEQCRAHLSLQPYDDSDATHPDDDMILGWLTAAREYCEAFAGLSYATKTLEVAVDVFPSSSNTVNAGNWLELPFGPVREIVSVVIGEGSDAVTIDAELYMLDNYRTPHRIRPLAAWPSFVAAPNALRIRYLAGYGVDSDGGEAAPALALSAMKLMLAHLYENREETTEKAMATLPLGVHSLLRLIGARLGMA